MMTRLRRRKRAVILLVCIVSMAIFSMVFVSQSVQIPRTLDGIDDYDVSYGNNLQDARAKMYGADFRVKPMDRKPQAHVGGSNNALVENMKVIPIFNYNLDAAARRIQASNHKLLARTNTKMDYKMERSDNRNEGEEADTGEDDGEDNPYNYPDNPKFKPGDFDEVVKPEGNRSPDRQMNGHGLLDAAKSGERKQQKNGVQLSEMSPPGTLNKRLLANVDIHMTSHHQPQLDVLPHQHQPTQIQMPRLSLQPGDIRSSTGLPIIVDFLFWSDAVEDLVPKGVTAEDVVGLQEKIRVGRVSQIQKAQWNRCGRPKNQYIVFKDNSTFCARYRHPHDKLIHGEILSFYLSRMLGLDSVPVVMLSQVNSTSPQWRGHNLTKTEWQQGTIIALIQWIHHLTYKESQVTIPTVILDAYESGYAFNWTHPALRRMTAGQLQVLLQWSDLILFDYITGNYDRVASMQDGAYEKGSSDIMREHIRNLRQNWQTRKMWLIDNESGLLDSYELMYNGGESGLRFINFHQRMLKSNCIFRRSTVGQIQQLADSDDPAYVLMKHTEHYDSLYHKLPVNSKCFKIFTAHFHIRLKEILDWAQSCKTIGRTLS